MFDLISMFVLIMTSILLDLSIGQEFCDSYKNNNFSVLIHSPDSKNLLFVIEDKYWIINKVEEHLELNFKGSQTKAHGSHKLLTNNISAMFSLSGFELIGKKYGQDFTFEHIFVFHDVSEAKKKMPFMYFGFEDSEPFYPVCEFNSSLNPCPTAYRMLDNLSIEDIAYTISTEFVFKEGKGNETKIVYHKLFVKQSEQYSNGQKIYELKMKAMAIAINNVTKILEFTLYDGNHSFVPLIYDWIQNMTKELPLIGLLLPADLAIFKSDTAIIYCSIYGRCPPTDRQVLIDCATVPTTGRYLILIVIGGIFLLVVTLMLIVALLYKCYINNIKPDNSLEEISTVDSTTGEPSMSSRKTRYRRMKVKDVPDVMDLPSQSNIKTVDSNASTSFSTDRSPKRDSTGM